VHITSRNEPHAETFGLNGDLSRAIASGQFEVHRWEDSYLANGRFDGPRMQAYLLRALRDGRGRGYATTRLIGDMQWARDDVPGVDGLVAYEAKLDEVLRGRPATVVCAYDVRRHSASRISSIVAAHESTLEGGRLRRATDRRRLRPRERILSAASRLFAKTGIQGSSVDALIESAGVAKATFYRHFRSKDDLIVAWLEDPRTRWLDRVRLRAERDVASPDEVIDRFIDAVGEWLDTEDLRGCPYLNAAVEITDPAHPAIPVIRGFLDEIEQYLRDKLAAAGYRDPGALAAELQTIVAGGITLAVARQTNSFADSAGRAARRLLDGAERTRARPMATSARR
jgi:AcrR family transcriptional regulator